MSNLPILIITASPDPHADDVEKHITSQGGSCIRFNSNEISPDLYIGYSSESSLIYLNFEGKSYTPSDFQSIWYRKPELWLKDQLPLKAEAGLEYKFRKGEITSMVRQFLLQAETESVFILNPFSVNEAARHKLLQLSQAKELGFTIPETLVTTSPDELESFINRFGQCIVKVLSTAYVEYGRKQMNFHTYSFTPATFAKVRSSVAFDQPVFVQERIIKDFELRLTVVGNKIFSCRIDSQVLPETQADFRTIPPDQLPHSEFVLPSEIKNLCLNLCKQLHLVYAAIDLAVTPEGRYVFFEVNPNGQYLWIEDQTGLPISKSIATLLLNQGLDK